MNKKFKQLCVLLCRLCVCVCVCVCICVCVAIWSALQRFTRDTEFELIQTNKWKKKVEKWRTSKEKRKKKKTTSFIKLSTTKQRNVSDGTICLWCTLSFFNYAQHDADCSNCPNYLKIFLTFLSFVQYSFFFQNNIFLFFCVFYIYIYIYIYLFIDAIRKERNIIFSYICSIFHIFVKSCCAQHAILLGIQNICLLNITNEIV